MAYDGYYGDEDEEDYSPPISHEFPVRVLVSFLTGKGNAKATEIEALKMQLAPPSVLYNLKNVEHFSNAQIDLLLKFELLRQESLFKERNQRLRGIYAVADNCYKANKSAREQGKARPHTDIDIAEQVNKAIGYLPNGYPRSIAVSALSDEDYQKRKLSYSDVLCLLEHYTMSATLNEFTNPPQHISYVPLIKQARIQEENKRKAEEDALIGADCIPSDIAQSPLDYFVRTLLMLSVKKGFVLLPQNIRLEGENGLVIKCSDFAAGEITRFLSPSQKHSSASGNDITSYAPHFTLSIERPEKIEEGVRVVPVKIHISGLALISSNFVNMMREKINTDEIPRER